LGLYIVIGCIFIPGHGLDGVILIKTLVAAFGCILTFWLLGNRKALVKLALALLFSAVLVFAITFAVHHFRFYL
ncbi:MAG TPA: hypothetical protein VEC37_15830, partial [Bacillota bacterium]|nr:hypothetical protein [Bacillota bacterium]